jgi:hypothetical protein
MVAFLQHADDFPLADKPSHTPSEIALLYGQIRHKFPGKHLPEDPAPDQMEAVVLAFCAGRQIVQSSGR